MLLSEVDDNHPHNQIHLAFAEKYNLKKEQLKKKKKKKKKARRKKNKD